MLPDVFGYGVQTPEESFDILPVQDYLVPVEVVGSVRTCSLATFGYCYKIIFSFCGTHIEEICTARRLDGFGQQVLAEIIIVVGSFVFS